MRAEEYEPQATVVADEDTILVAGHGGVVPLSFAEARAVRDSLTALLLTFDRGPETVLIDTDDGPKRYSIE
jgi:hypothetical protein